MMVPQPSRTLDLQRKEELILQKQIRQSTAKIKNNLPTLIGRKYLVFVQKLTIDLQRHHQTSTARNCPTSRIYQTVYSPSLARILRMMTPARVWSLMTFHHYTVFLTNSDLRAGRCLKLACLIL